MLAIVAGKNIKNVSVIIRYVQLFNVKKKDRLFRDNEVFYYILILIAFNYDANYGIINIFKPIYCCSGDN